MRVQPYRVQGWLAILGTFSLLLGLYSRTLLPGLVGGDAGELQYAGPLLALTHPQGQPLYLSISYLWSHLFTIGSYAWRMNLLAAVWGAGTCALVTAMTFRLYRLPWVALASGITLGLGATLWGQSVIADKYAFSAFCVALVTGLTLIWIDQRHLPKGYYWLYAMAIAFGLGLMHHRSIYMLAPGMAIVVLWHYRKTLLQHGHILLITGALALIPPLIVYSLFLPWVRSRQLSPLMWQPTVPEEWVYWWLEWYVITGEALVFDNTQAISNQLSIYLETLYHDYSWAVIAIAFIGMIVLIRHVPLSFVFLATSFALAGGFAANFRGNERQFTYYLPSFVILSYGYATGLTALWTVVKSRLSPSWHKIFMSIGILGIGVICLYQGSYAYPIRWNQAVSGDTLDIWRQTLKSGTMAERLTDGFKNVPENAVVVGDWEQITPLWYLQQVEGYRPDVELKYPITQWVQYQEEKRPICLARHLAINQEWHPTNVGALVCLQETPLLTIPQDLQLTQLILNLPQQPSQLELIGYQLATESAKPGQHLPLLLTWQSLNEDLPDYSISLRLIDPQGQVVFSNDMGAPVIGMYPTSRWVKNEIVQDYHEISIPSSAIPGEYQWALVVYRALEDGTFLQLQAPDGTSEIKVGTLTVLP
jgi:hypothetical protein